MKDLILFRFESTFRVTLVLQNLVSYFWKFSRDVTAAILVFKSQETTAILVSQTYLPGMEF